MALCKLSENMLKIRRTITQSVRSTSCLPFHVEEVCACVCVHACVCVCVCCKTVVVIQCFLLSCGIILAVYDTVWLPRKDNRINWCLLRHHVNWKLNKFQTKGKEKRLREKSYHIYAIYPGVMLLKSVINKH